MPRPHPLVVAPVVFALSTLVVAQGGRGRQRPEEIQNRTGAFFVTTQGPEAAADAPPVLADADLVRAATSAGQMSVLYLFDGNDDPDGRAQFERALFAGDELGIELRCFHCGRIDLAKDRALAAKYGKAAPLFVVFDAHGKSIDVAMSGYKPSASALTRALEKTAQGLVKPSLGAWAKDYGGFVRDLEQALARQQNAEERLARAGADKQKRAATEKDLQAATAEVQAVLAHEAALLAKVPMPPRAENAERLGGRGPGPGSGDGGGGRGGNPGRGGG